MAGDGPDREILYPPTNSPSPIMPHISAFRGLRYNLGQVGSLSSVVAPPYDVIDPELQQQLYDANEYNVVRLILGRDEPGDDESNNRYTRAAKMLKAWHRDGVLQTENDPAIYVYHQTYTANGQEYNRRGFMCRCRLERFGEGNIYPHEETHGGAKADRLKLWKACRANLSQIFGLYPDNFNRAQVILEGAIAEHTPLEATDHLGVVNQLWPVTDIESITMLEAAMAQQPIYIADGHHRYETACNYRDEVAAAYREQHGKDLPYEHPANYVLMMCVSMSDPGMQVLPTHRLFRGVQPLTALGLAEKLGDSFETEPAGTGADRATSLWEEIEVEDEQGTLGFYTAEDDAWTLARITERRPREACGGSLRPLRRLAVAGCEHPAPPGDGHPARRAKPARPEVRSQLGGSAGRTAGRRFRRTRPNGPGGKRRPV